MNFSFIYLGFLVTSGRLGPFASEVLICTNCIVLVMIFFILFPSCEGHADRAQSTVRTMKPCVSFLTITFLNIINNKNVSFLIIYIFPSCEGVMRTVPSWGPAEGRCWATRRRGRFLLVHECLRAILLRGRGIRLGILPLPAVQVRNQSDLFHHREIDIKYLHLYAVLQLCLFWWNIPPLVQTMFKNYLRRSFRVDKWRRKKRWFMQNKLYDITREVLYINLLYSLRYIIRNDSLLLKIGTPWVGTCWPRPLESSMTKVMMTAKIWPRLTATMRKQKKKSTRLSTLAGDWGIYLLSNTK